MSGMIKKLDQLNSHRPAYTKYEISKMVKDKRVGLGMSIEEFSVLKDVESNLLEDIEIAKRSFNVRIMRACSKILDMSLEELTREDSEDLESYSFRCDEMDNSINELVKKVDTLFNEIVMQKKLSAQ